MDFSCLLFRKRAGYYVIHSFFTVITAVILLSIIVPFFMVLVPVFKVFLRDFMTLFPARAPFHHY
jgi:Mn2+/Fe2+ NRAMP family transporter